MTVSPDYCLIHELEHALGYRPDAPYPRESAVERLQSDEGLSPVFRRHTPDGFWFWNYRLEVDRRGIGAAWHVHYAPRSDEQFDFPLVREGGARTVARAWLLAARAADDLAERIAIAKARSA